MKAIGLDIQLADRVLVVLKGRPYVPLSDAQVADFAKQVYRNELFTSWMIAPLDRDSLLSMVFTPLLFMKPWQVADMIEQQAHTLYASMRGGMSPRSVNGYPMFFEVGWWTKEDAERVLDMTKQIDQVMEKM